LLEESDANPSADAPTETGLTDRRSWRDGLRDRVVGRGIKWMCGTSTDVPTAAAADIRIFSGGMRFAWLRILRTFGVTTVVARSGFDHPFVCHIGDVAEFPYYHRRALAPELALCTAWLRGEPDPVVYDVGANVGFFSTQLLQMTAPDSLRIHAFEPVPTTFAKLVRSVQTLGLDDRIFPVEAAVLHEEGTVTIAYSDLNSLFSQVAREDRPSDRTGTSRAEVPAISLDTFQARTGTRPALIKIDVEGSEAAVLLGARQMLAGPNPPAIVLEVSPSMLTECGASLDDLERLMSDYSFHYVDDIAGQKRPFGSPVASLGALTWTCNLFAVPRTDVDAKRCVAAFAAARRMLSSLS
jgi:FkbM family methyltransferase